MVILMKAKAFYEIHVLRPLDRLDLEEGEEVEVVVKKKLKTVRSLPAGVYHLLNHPI